jgi:protein-tyrosine phosphatase
VHTSAQSRSPTHSFNLSTDDEEIDESKERRILGRAADKMTRKINKRTEKYGQVTKHILIGNRECAQDAILLQNVGVTHVLNICHQLPNYHPQKFIYMKIDVAGEFIHESSRLRFLDAFICAQAESCSSCGASADAPTTNLLPYYRKTSKFLANVESKGGRALVHCVAGCSRSVTIVLMHLMGHHGVHLREGWEHVKQYRPQTCPNESFKLQLAKLEVSRQPRSCAANSALFLHLFIRSFIHPNIYICDTPNLRWRFLAGHPWQQ